MARVYAETYSPPTFSQRDSLMENKLYGSDVISMRDLAIDQIKLILDTAARLKTQPEPDLLRNRVIAHCFF
jgi:aspartate carbamoyltransferase catalytic subunit